MIALLYLGGPKMEFFSIVVSVVAVLSLLACCVIFALCYPAYLCHRCDPHHQPTRSARYTFQVDNNEICAGNFSNDQFIGKHLNNAQSYPKEKDEVVVMQMHNLGDVKAF